MTKTTIRVEDDLRDRVKNLRKIKENREFETQEEVVARLVGEEERRKASDRQFARG